MLGALCMVYGHLGSTGSVALNWSTSFNVTDPGLYTIQRSPNNVPLWNIRCVLSCPMLR